MSGTQIRHYTFMIWTDGSAYYRTHGVTGEVTSSSNCSYLIISNMAADTSFFFAPGTYVLDSAITLSSGVTFGATPWTATLQLAALANLGVNVGLLQGTDLENIVISGLVLDGNKAGQTAAVSYSRNIRFSNCTNVLIENCQVFDAVFTGIDVRGIDGLIINNCLVNDNGAASNPINLGIGIYIRNSGAQDCENVTVSNVVCNGNGEPVGGDGSGIQVYGQGNVVLSNVICNGNTRYGIKSQCGNLTVTGFQVNYNSFGLSVSTGFDANTTVITSGEAFNNSAYGIYLTAPATISNVEVAYTLGTGIRAEAYQSFQGLVISGCNTHDNTQHGINIRGVDVVTIVGCMSHSNGQNGIELGNYTTRQTDYSIVSACNTWTNGAYGFREASTSTCDHNVFIGCITESNGNDGFALEGANSRVFSSWNGTHWQDDSP